jgi:UDP-2-acetamido-2,6-beta-L-arabino-hexul-4-ose reductase
MKNLLITGARGFIGKNLISHLEQLNDKSICLFKYDIDSSSEDLERFTSEADFVIHLAGINRPLDQSEYDKGNRGFTELLLEKLARYKKPSVLMSSSIQASLSNPYGVSKLGAEAALREYSKQTGAKAFIYRLPNVFGKWSKPYYNSAVATFCYNIARGLPIQINDPDKILHLAYIDDVCKDFIKAIKGEIEPNEEGFVEISPTYKMTVGHVAELIRGFAAGRMNLFTPNSSDELEKKLYSTYLSFLPKDAFSYSLKTNEDSRGSFTELLKTKENGQMSVNTTKPGITKGNHWHHTKNEKFIVVQGEALIRLRQVNEEEIHEYRVSGEQIEIVDIPVGYTHSITNMGYGDLITIMWANECYDLENPDTYFLEV